MDKQIPVTPSENRREQQPTRKPYNKPAFRFERVFETQALSCGKISATQKHCRFNRKAS
jgi:hypothetical protein